jgi:hypothetical protein
LLICVAPPTLDTVSVSAPCIILNDPEKLDDPLTNSDPVITALPLYGNVVAVTPVNPVPSPLNDPVKEPVNGAVSEVNCVELDTTPAGNVAVAFAAYDAVVANELDTALLAQLAVPNVEPLRVPINDPVNEPVLICAELDTVPVGKNAITCAELLTMFVGTLLSPV